VAGCRKEIERIVGEAVQTGVLPTETLYAWSFPVADDGTALVALSIPGVPGLVILHRQELWTLIRIEHMGPLWETG